MSNEREMLERELVCARTLVSWMRAKLEDLISLSEISILIQVKR